MIKRVDKRLDRLEIKMKRRTITRILSTLLVCVLAFTDCGSRWIEGGGAMTVQAAEDQEEYIDYFAKAEELETPLAIYNYLKNNINYEYYAGRRKGPEAVYDSQG